MASRKKRAKLRGRGTEGLGRAIKVIRAAEGLQRKDLADRAGISYPYLSQIEQGVKSPSASALDAIASALNMRPHELLATADALTVGPAPGPAAELRPQIAALMAENLMPMEPSSSLPMGQMASFQDAGQPPAEADRSERRRWFSEDAPVSRTSSAAGRKASIEQLIRLTKALSPEDVDLVLQLVRRLTSS